MVQRIVRFSVVALALLSASILLAHGPVRPVAPRTNVSVALESEFGERLETFGSRGQTFVLGRHGQRYNVRVNNNGPERVEVVLSIDGRDAVSGQLTDLVRHRGYVIGGYGTLLVQGFRTSLDSVASFRFTDPGSSYTGRMGTPQAVGIIQVAAFEERRSEPTPIAIPDEEWRPWPRRGMDDASGEFGGAGKRAAPPAAPTTAQGAPFDLGAPGRTRDDIRRMPPRERTGNLGTEFGERQQSRVVEVDFERANPRRPSQWVTVRYDDEEGLEARGIEVRPRVMPLIDPMPRMPLVPEESRFSTPPPPRPWYSPWGVD